MRVLQTPLTVLNNLTGVGQALNIVGNQTITFDGPSQHISNFNIVGESYNTVIFIGGPSSTGPVGLTIDSNASLQGGATNFNGAVLINGENNHGSLTNNGSINSYGQLGSVQIENLDTLTNNGMMTSNGGTDYDGEINLAVDGTVTTFTNNGTISAVNGGTIGILAANWANAVGASMSAASGSLLAFKGIGTNQSAINISGNLEIEAGGSLTNNGTLTLNSGSIARINGTYAGSGLMAANGLLYVNSSSTAGLSTAAAAWLSAQRTAVRLSYS